MKTKQILNTALAAIFIVAGCGDGELPGSGRKETVGARGDEATSKPERAAEASVEDELIRFGTEAARELKLDRVATGDLDAMIERRVIRAMVPFSKTYYFLDGPKQMGATYEGFKLLEDWLNKELGTGVLKVHVLVVPTLRDQLLPSLTEGLGDIAAGGLTITSERSRLVDFTNPFASGVNEIVVTGAGAPSLTSLEDLAGREIYVRKSSSYYESLLKLNRTLEDAGKEPVRLLPAEEYLEDEDLLEMVDSGMLNIVVVDQHKAEFWDQIFDDITLHPDLQLRTGGEIAWAFRKGSPELEQMLNRFVGEHKKGTLMGNIILKRYLQDTKRVENVLSGAERERFRNTVGFFRKYAPQYELDPLLMVAQGYQESRLDQSVVSHVGAIGIMQVLPSTAKDPAVGIPDIHVAEHNVHAGIKYMRWIRDRYFADEAIDELNKTLFSFASYNGGPNRIARLRKRATERGLDPNVWFRSVEVIVAEEIGRETVQYVSNIYKYYAAYRLLQARDALARKAPSE